MTITVIIPTCGRDTLRRTLESLSPARLRQDDEVIVVSDGPQPASFAIATKLCGIKYVEAERTKDFGGHQRNIGMELARGTHLAFMDDDDEYAPGAFDRLHKDVDERPQHIHIYKMIRWDGVVTWSEKKLYYGNIGTPMFIVPNIPDRLGRWSSNGGHDYQFLRDTVEKWPDREARVVWHDHIICRLRPHRRGTGTA
jgi:glycosyltransferase involved in cell wall biosynthesis